MLKHFAILIFILAVTGQAFAGVCGCFAIEAKMPSCCKPHNAKRASLYPKGCCDDECLMRASERTSQTRAEALTKITVAAEASQAPISMWSFAPIAFTTAPKISPFDDHRLKYSRPPELYLKTHAFLI